MILPIANIVSGFVLAAPKLKAWGAKTDIETAEGKLNKFRAPIGVIILILGIIGLLKRMSFMYDWSWQFGSSYPQALIAIAMGLLLSANFFAGMPALHSRIISMNKYAEWIGILGIIVGIGSLI